MKNSTPRQIRRPRLAPIGATEISDRMTDVEEEIFEVLGTLRLIGGAAHDENEAQMEPIDMLGFCRLIDKKLSDVLEAVQHVNSLVNDPQKLVASA